MKVLVDNVTNLVDKVAKKLGVSNKTASGFLLILVGVSISGTDRIISSTSNFSSFIAGLSTGLSVGIMLVGIFLTMRGFVEPSESK